MSTKTTVNVQTTVATETLYGIEMSIVEQNIPMQLHGCYQPELNKGKGGFVITTEDLDKAGERSWAQVSLTFPQEGEDGEIKIRLALNIIQGAARKVGLSDGQVVNSFEANVPDPALRGSKANKIIRLRTNYMLLRDLFAVSNFDVVEQNRIVSWCRNYINQKGAPANLTLVPKDDSTVLAFDVKTNVHPDSGIVAANTPIGMNNFYLGNFGLLPNSAMSTFGGSFKIKNNNQVINTKIEPVSEIENRVVTEEDI